MLHCSPSLGPFFEDMERGKKKYRLVLRLKIRLIAPKDSQFSKSNQRPHPRHTVCVNKRAELLQPGRPACKF